jgi:hypothetical protein
VKKQDHRVVAILATEADVLIDAADRHVAGFVDSARGGDAIGLLVPPSDECAHLVELLGGCSF